MSLDELAEVAGIELMPWQRDVIERIEAGTAIGPTPGIEAAVDAVRYVQAVEWTCGDCHDTGYARTPADAAAALGEHREDYH